MKKLMRSLRNTEVDTFSDIIYGLFLQEQRDESAVGTDIFLQNEFAEIGSLSQDLTFAIRQERVKSNLDRIDKDRNGLIRKISNAISGFYSLEIDEQKEAAVKVYEIFKRYGKQITRESYYNKSSLIESLLMDFNNAIVVEYIKKLTGLEELVSKLRATEDDFKKNYKIYSEAIATRNIAATDVKDVLCKRINTRLVPYMDSILLTNESEYLEFYKKIEYEINHVNSFVKNRTKKTDDTNSD